MSRNVALVIIAGAGIVGAFIGRAARNDTPHVQAHASVSPAPSGTTPAANECAAERAALASIKSRLAVCMTNDTAPSGTVPSGVPEKPESALGAIIAEEIKSYQERLASLSEAVIVRHPGGAVRVYEPHEWPSDGDGVIIGRKFKDGHIERYPFGVRPRATH
ncbi:hypothetical protein [Sorangium sp. So ce131]|uniref:hypothetical protein n=1 Tax=Sorangium sp. So ce131 TaxID=3133282 RepID=UPI003F5D584A